MRENNGERARKMRGMKSKVGLIVGMMRKVKERKIELESFKTKAKCPDTRRNLPRYYFPQRALNSTNNTSLLDLETFKLLIFEH